MDSQASYRIIYKEIKNKKTNKSAIAAIAIKMNFEYPKMLCKKYARFLNKKENFLF